MKPKTVVAKTDKYLDGARGLFTPHQRGFARKPVSVAITTPTVNDTLKLSHLPRSMFKKRGVKVSHC